MLNDTFVWPIEFGCTLVTENIIVPNYYSIKLSIEPYDQSPDNVTLGFRKLRHFVDNCLHNSVIINQTHTLVSSFKTMDNNVVLTPVDPYDYFLGAILYCKFFSISEKYFDIIQISIDSSIGDRVQYNIFDPSECGIDLTGEFWWNMDTAQTGVERGLTWNELNLASSQFMPRVIQGGLSEDR